jgi:excisionase family DNA binding protein
MIGDPLLTVDEVSEWLRVSPSVVRRLARDGHLSHVRPTPRRVRIPASSVEAHIRRNTFGGDAAADLSGLKWITPPRQPSGPSPP